MTRAGALGGDQAALLVEAQRRGCDAASLRHLADRQQFGHATRKSHSRLDFKLTLTCSLVQTAKRGRTPHDQDADGKRADHRGGHLLARASPPGPAAAASSRSRSAGEIGHLHGDHALHIGFPKKVWHELYDQGGSTTTPVFPGKPATPPGGSRTPSRRRRRDRDAAHELRPGDRTHGLPRRAGERP